MSAIPLKHKVFWFLKRAILFSLLASIITISFLTLPHIFAWAYSIPSIGLGKYIDNGVVVREKTLWDWLGLLIVPLALGVSAWFVGQITRRSDRATEDRRAASERQIAEGRIQETDLQIYLDQIADLLLQHQLGGPNTSEEVKVVARARTLTVLRKLNGERKGLLIRFLFEAGLIKQGGEQIDLHGADLSNANLYDAELSGISLKGAQMHGADLRYAKLLNADLTGAYLNNALLYGADFSGACLKGAFFDDVELRSVIFREADMTGIWMNAARPIDVSFDAATLTGASICESDLRRCRFIEADLSGATLVGSNLSDVKLSNADLSAAYLGGVNFKGAVLTGSDLRHADLNGANLGRANLRDAKIENDQLKSVSSLRRAILPDGSKHR